jgi:ORF6N domain
VPKRPTGVLTTEAIAARIHFMRREKVLLDGDLAALYGVETRRLNEQVRRNRERFPADFIFQLSAAEFLDLKSQFATSSWGGRRKLPLAFTEHGAIMAATILNSSRAVEMSVYVVRAFVRMREAISQNREIAKKLDALERRIDSQDETIVEIVQTIRKLMEEPSRAAEPRRRPIGFVTPKEK